MVTKEQALTANTFHYTGQHACTMRNTRRQVTTARRTRATWLWPNDSTRFNVPVTYGAQEWGDITEKNAEDYHVAEECPLRQGR
jgi:hypothetical protein